MSNAVFVAHTQTHKNTEQRATEEGYDGRICEMNAEGPTDVSVPPFNRKE